MTVQSRWKPVFFIAGQLVAVLLLVSWWVEASPLKAFWEELDRRVFYWLNGLLAEDTEARTFWAVANNRWFDLVGACLFGLIFLQYVLADQQGFTAQRIGLFFFLLLFSALVVLLVDQGFEKVERNSPSLVLKPVYKLSELVPQIKSKDGSGQSFPSDHAIYLFMWSGFYFLFLGWVRGLFALVLALILTTPRLVSGAHWFTDNYVGGLSIALIGFTWMAATPLRQKAMVWLTPFGRLLAPVLLQPLRWLRLIR